MFWAGPVCSDAGYSNFNRAVARGGATVNCADTSIPTIDTDLDVPQFDENYNFSQTIDGDWVIDASTNEAGRTASIISIPSGSNQFYDILVKGDLNIKDGCDTLYIENPGNRYVRIFIKGSLTIGGSKHNIVVLDQNGIVTNANYAGNLLFYTPNDISFPAQDAIYQGTYISGGTIKFMQHYRFAGQLLAKKISIDSEFKAGDFRYVPFRPPVINMAVGSMAYEDNEARGDTVKLVLSKDPPTRVTFDYCFSLKPASECDGFMDDPACSFANANDVLESNYTEIPVCGRDTGHAAFPQFSKDLETAIVFHAKDDMLEEADELVLVKIFNLTAAITPDGDRNADSSYSMEYVIVDNDKRPVSKDTSVTVMMNETLPITAFPAYENDGVTVLDKYGVIIKTLPASGTLKYNGAPVAAGDFIKVPGSLNYTPAHDEYGSPYTTFEFVVANIHNPDISDTARTMTINVVRFQYTINENASVDTLVGIIDELRISDIESCAIVSGDTGATFRFDTTRIYVNGVLDFETQSSYVFFVKCANSTSEDSTAVEILIVDENDPPSVTDTVMQVSENMPVGATVGTMLYYDQDGENSGFCENSFSLVGGDSSLFKIDAQTGVITTREVFDYEALPDSQKYYVVKVQIADTDGNKSVAEVKINIVNVMETSVIVVTHAESGNGNYNESNPKEPIKINDKTLTLSWTGDAIPQPDTTLTDLHEGYNVVTLTYYDTTKDMPAVKEVTIFVCTKTPEVQVSTTVEKMPDANIYTIAEEPVEGDTAFYVNKKQNNISVKVKEPVLDSTYTDSTCKYTEREIIVSAVMFETLNVPQATFKTVEKIASEKPVLNDMPAGSVKQAPFNDSLVLVSYREAIGNDSVTVSYVTNAKGDVVDGQIKVSFTTKIDGKAVEISYVADAFTGAPVESETGAVYTVSYRYTDRNGESVTVGYALDSKGKTIEDKDGNVGYEVIYTYENAFGNVSSQSIYIVVDVIPPKVEILSPENNAIFYANYVDVKWTVDRNDGNGPVVMDTLTEQGLVKGGNAIVRFYRDKAGNVASDTVKVIMKNSKDLDISVVTPVTIVT
ncbi:MAG: cadherin repeat domain-containing protein, partial [Fibrobacter sp.]|nr:cadherin repeat domain-containing protein [Fibrobacter sp.]